MKSTKFFISLAIITIAMSSSYAQVEVVGVGSTNTTKTFVVKNSISDTSLAILDNGDVGIGISIPTEKLQVLGTIQSTSGGFKFPDGTTQVTASETLSIPSGIIVMWSGLLTNVPAGWVLCDGTNETPDLRDRFIFGASEGENPGATGGTTSHTHNIDPPNTESSYETGSVEFVSFGASMSVPTSQHTHYVDILSFSSDIESTIPPFFKLAFIMKQ